MVCIFSKIYITKNIRKNLNKTVLENEKKRLKKKIFSKKVWWDVLNIKHNSQEIFEEEKKSMKY